MIATVEEMCTSIESLPEYRGCVTVACFCVLYVTKIDLTSVEFKKIIRLKEKSSKARQSKRKKARKRDGVRPEEAMKS